MIGYVASIPLDFSNFGSLKSTETGGRLGNGRVSLDFSNFGSLKSTETLRVCDANDRRVRFQQFRLVEEH